MVRSKNSQEALEGLNRVCGLLSERTVSEEQVMDGKVLKKLCKLGDQSEMPELKEAAIELLSILSCGKPKTLKAVAHSKGIKIFLNVLFAD